MPSASSAAAAPKVDDRRRQILETGALQFHIKTGGARYVCKVMDRPTLERERSSSASIKTTSTVESGSSSFVSK